MKQKENGKYEKAGIDAMKAGELEYSGNNDMALISLKVLDKISECNPELPIKYALVVLEDAKNIILQLHGI